MGEIGARPEFSIRVWEAQLGLAKRIVSLGPYLVDLLAEADLRRSVATVGSIIRPGLLPNTAPLMETAPLK
jgi:hypothetical protein